MKPRISLAADYAMFNPGERVAVAVSGGADSVALLRALHSAAAAQGLVLRVAHVHHGLRGAEADADAEFVRSLASQLELPLESKCVDAAAYAGAHGQSLEQVGRAVRYQFFTHLLESGTVDVVATAHTLNDQAETVLLKLLRGGWTEGLGGISPVVQQPRGRIARPMLQVARRQIEDYLRALGQEWREDSSNAGDAFMRNRVRRQLLPLMRTFNPRIIEQLARIADIARQEEAYWHAEVARTLPGILLPGRPVRGGGRSVSTVPGEDFLALDLQKLAATPVALRRRLLRATARALDKRLEFDDVAEIEALLCKKPGSRVTLPRALRVTRTAREIHFSIE